MLLLRKRVTYQNLMRGFLGDCEYTNLWVYFKKKLSFLDQNHIFHKLLFFYGDLYLFALIHKDCALKEEVEYISIVLDNFSKFFVYI